MKNIFDSEISALNNEILALKTEKSKRLDDLILSKQSIHLTLQRGGGQVDILVSPTNNVTPLITYYIDVGNTDMSQIWLVGGMMHKEYGFDSQSWLSFRLDNRSSVSQLDFDLVFVSTSILDIEVD